MADTREKIIDIRINYEKSIEKIGELRSALDDLKKNENDLKKSLKEGTISRDEYNKAMAASKIATDQTKETMRDIEKVMKNQIKTEKEQEGSLKSLRAQLSNLTKEYDSMSAAERTSASGTALRDKINEITTTLKENEEATQRYYRNVGNYENAIGSAFEKLSKEIMETSEAYKKIVEEQGAASEAAQQMKEKLDDLQNEMDATQEMNARMNEGVLGFIAGGNPFAVAGMKMAQQLGSVRNAFSLATTGAKMLGKQLLALMANPIVAFLGLIAASISILVKGIKSSEDNMNRWKMAMAPLGVALDFVENAITGLASGILTVIETGGKLLGWISKAAEKLPFLGNAFKAANEKMQERADIQRNQIKLEKMQRDEIVKSAEREKAVSELKAKVAQKDKYTANERLTFLDKAIKIEQEQAAKQKEMAELNLKNLEREAALTENDAEMNNKLAEAKAAVIKAETDYNNKVRELSAQRVEAINQEKTERANAAKERAEKLKEQKSIELEAVRAAEDAMLALMVESSAKFEAQIKLSYSRQIEDLKKRLEEEKNLTKTAREAINQQILALEQQQAQELAKVQVDELKKRISDRQNAISLELETVKAGSEAEFKLQIEQLVRWREAQLAEANLTEEQKNLIWEAWAAKDDALREQRANDLINKEVEKRRIAFETEMLQLGENETAKLELELEYKRQELESLQQLEGESIEEFNLRKLQMTEEYNNAQKALADKEVQIAKDKASAIADTFGSISSAMEQMGSKSRAMVILSKTLALAEVLINTGIGISNVVKNAKTASSVWEMIAQIAAGIGTVMGAIVSAKKSISEAKFSTGGLVTGEGSGTSDSIQARLSNGESVMTAQATSMFSPILSMFNTMGGGVPIQSTQVAEQVVGEDMLARAVAKGVQSMPNPVVSVEEINRTNRRVQVLENISTT